MIGRGCELNWNFDPLEALRRWPADRRVTLLHSGRHHPRWARWSILAEPRGTYRFTAGEGTSGRSEWCDGPAELGVNFTHSPFHDLRELLYWNDGPWIGHLSYDLGRWVENLPSHAIRDRSWSIIELAFCPGYLAYDLATRRWHACGAWEGGGFPRLDLIDTPGIHPPLSVNHLRSAVSRETYERSVARVIEYIAAGDIFQANLAQRFTADIRGEIALGTRDLFMRLMRISPAWYGAYLELLGTKEQPRPAILSTSPELFLELDVHGRIVTRPIKGTRPATASVEELHHSEKDTAELNMIVDLLRNDLGRVCTYGSVQVPQQRVIESHPTVHHGVATVTGQLHAGKDIVDLLRATIPGGSITGAPKVRAMQIIDELEPVRRGPYCGAIGLLSRDEACLNIAIRTILVEQDLTGAGRLDFSVGGGVVADSQPAREFQETLDKAAAILSALGLTQNQPH